MSLTTEQIEALKNVYQIVYDKPVCDEDAGIAQWQLEQNFATDILGGEDE